MDSSQSYEVKLENFGFRSFGQAQEPPFVYGCLKNVGFLRLTPRK